MVTSYPVVAVDPTGVKVFVKFGDSRSNRSRDIRLPHVVTNDVDNDNDDAGRRTIIIGQNIAHRRFAKKRIWLSDITVAIADGPHTLTSFSMTMS